MADLATIERKARYGHKSIVYWYDTTGSLQWARYSKDAIKRAILAVGIKGKFYWIDPTGCHSVAKSWRMMIHIWRCARAA